MITSTQPWSNVDDHQSAAALRPFMLLGVCIIPATTDVASSATAAAALPLNHNFLNQETLNPMPLRSFNPQEGRFSCISTSLPESNNAAAGVSASSGSHHSETSKLVAQKPSSKRRKRKNEDDVGNKGKRKASSIDSLVVEAPPSVDQIRRLVEIVESHNGTSPVFLYQKRLQVSDTNSSQNRLFFNELEKLMEFLREEERRVVMVEGKAVDVDGLDEQWEGEGTLYKLKISKWGSRVVLNGKWHKLIEANGAKAGDIVQLWGYRYRYNLEEPPNNNNNNLGFAVHFKKSQDHHHQLQVAHVVSN